MNKASKSRSTKTRRRGALPVVARLRTRLEEVEATLEAIRSGAVDALVIEGAQGEQVFTLEGADHRYRRLVETMNEGAAVVRPDGLIVYCNRRFADMLDRPHSRVLGTLLPTLARVASRDTIQALIDHAQTGTARAEVEMVTGGGATVPVYLSATRNDTDEAAGVSMIATDLREQRRSARVVAAERLAASIVEQASEALVVCDATGRVIRASHAARRLAGRSPVLQLFGDAFALQGAYPDQPGAPRDWIARAIGGDTVAGVEVVLPRGDGPPATLLMSAGPLMTEEEGVIGCVVSLVDISARRDAEQRLRRALAEQIIARDELEAMAEKERDARRAAETATRLKDEFLATVSHELRTPLSAIVGWTAILRTGRLDEDKRGHALDTIQRNARAQTQLIDDLLDVSRIISGKLRLDVEPVDLSAVIRNASDAVQPMADAKGIRLHTTLDGEASPVSGDADRLQQVVWNLLSNAVKFTPRGGQVRTLLTRRGPDAVIEVQDNGQGIPADFLPFVFDRFRQADATPNRTKAGLGLGLAIVRHLVEQHGGTVQAQSDGRDRGATFVIRIPVAPALLPARAGAGGADRADDEADDVLPAEEGEGVPPQRLEGVRVLVVDDESDSRELMVEVLGDGGADVSTAHSAVDGLARLRVELPDVLVSDIGMPGDDGLAFIKAVRALPPDKGGLTPAIALTGYARSEDREQALMAGFTLHMPKPISPAELVLMVSRLSGHEPSPQPSPAVAQIPAARGAKATLLLIEDAPDLQELLSEMLTTAGYRVVAASHGSEGLDRLRSGLPVNLILLDLMMPVMDGWRFREEQLHDPTFASIPVVVISANAEQSGRRIDANAVIPKPVDFDELLRAIDANMRPVFSSRPVPTGQG